MMHLSILSGDITAAKVDAIVNAANPIMLGGGGVDGAIHRAAGPVLLEECRKVQSVNGIRCPVGEARITGAGQLDAMFVIHTVGPRYRVDENPEKLLASAYANALNLALRNNCSSIAFPAISCGAYGYPLGQAADIALAECCQEKYRALSIQFYLMGNPILQIWRDALAKIDAPD